MFSSWYQNCTLYLLDLDKKFSIFSNQMKISDSCTSLFQKLEDSKQKSVGPSLPGDKENKLAHIKEKGMKNGKHVSSINSQVLKGDTFCP